MKHLFHKAPHGHRELILTTVIRPVNQLFAYDHCY